MRRSRMPSDKARLDWDSFLAGWDAATEGHTGTGEPWTSERIQADYNAAYEAYEAELAEEADGV